MRQSTPGPEELIAAVVEPIEELGLPKDRLIVVGGAAMQLMGIKRTRDIDVVMTLDDARNLTDWDENAEINWRAYSGAEPRSHELRFSGESKIIAANGYNTLARQYGIVTIMLPPNDIKYRATYSQLRSEALGIGGLLVSPPQRILEWKKGTNRSKDAKDIRLLEEYIGQRPVVFS